MFQSYIMSVIDFSIIICDSCVDRVGVTLEVNHHNLAQRTANHYLVFRYFELTGTRLVWKTQSTVPALETRDYGVAVGFCQHWASRNPSLESVWVQSVARGRARHCAQAEVKR